MCNYTTDNSLVDYDSPENNTYDKIPHDPFRDTQAVSIIQVMFGGWMKSLVGDFRISSREKRGHLMNGIDIRYFFVGMIKKSPSIFCANSESSNSQISSSLGSNGKHCVLLKVQTKVKI